MCRDKYKEIIIIGRFQALASKIKNKKDKFKIIRNELQYLWNKLNFQVIAMSSVVRKITKLIAKYEKFENILMVQPY